MSSCTLPWTGSRQQHGQEFNKNTSMVEHPTIVEDVDQEDSAFLEPEYSNPPSSFESFNQGKLTLKKIVTTLISHLNGQTQSDMALNTPLQLAPF